MSNEITLPNNWSPRPHQMAAWHAMESGIKRILLVWHRRAGKDSTMLNALVCKAIQTRGLYWLMAPKANQSRKIYFENIGSNGQKVIDQAIPLEIRTRTDKQSMTIELINGSVIQFVGSDNYDMLVGANPRGVIFTEWSLSNPTAWDYIRPILLENGGFVWMNGTPRGKNHLYDLFKKVKNSPEWFVQTLTVDDTGILSREEIQAEIEEYGMSPAKADQEFYCSWDAPIEGSYYGSIISQMENNGQIGEYARSRLHPVYTAWDIGISDYTCIWFFQIFGGKRRFIHYYENSGQDLGHYANYVQDRPYKYAKHLLPHDAQQRQGGTAGAPTRKKILHNYGLRNLALVATGPGMVEAGIDAVTRELPGCEFDAAGCAEGISRLKNYKRKYNEETKTFGQSPVHDASSDGADAFRMAIVGTSAIKKPGSGSAPVVVRDYSLFDQ